MQPSLIGMILRVFLPFAFGYFLSYLYRVINAVIAPDLVSELDLGPDVLGLLTASYFLTFAAFQLPLGVLLDKYGPRLVEAGLLLFAAGGACVFALADSSTGLIIGRALIGFGVSACLMASFKAFSLFYSTDKLPLVNGFIMAAGGLGAIMGTAPTEWVVQDYGWRGGFWGLAVLTILSALLVFLLVPKTTRAVKETTLAEQLAGVKQIFTSLFFWRVGLFTMFSQSSFISIQSLWVGPWHRDIAGLERADVANTLLWIACAMVVGFLSLGAIGAQLAKRGISTMKFAGVCMLAFLFVQFAIIMEWAVDYPVIWIAFGFFGTAGILQYAVMTHHFPGELAGRVNTALNLLVFVAIFVLQSLSGQVINLWEPAADGGYQSIAYQSAFGFFLLLQVCAFAFFIWPGKTKNRV